MNRPVVVTTSDNYLNSVRIFAYLFNKYWCAEQQVIVLGFAEPSFRLPVNFSFVSMGRQKDYPVNKWSNALIEFLDVSNFDHFALMLEDYWLVRKVNVRAIEMLFDYANQFRNVLKIDLCTDRLYSFGMTDYAECNYIDLIRSDYNSQYHMSLMTGIWNRELLLNYLIPDETPWDVEINGTPRVAASKDDILVLGTRQAPVRHILAHRGGDSSKYLLDGLHDVDLDYIKEKEWL